MQDTFVGIKMETELRDILEKAAKVESTNVSELVRSLLKAVFMNEYITAKLNNKKFETLSDIEEALEQVNLQTDVKLFRDVVNKSLRDATVLNQTILVKMKKELEKIKQEERDKVGNLTREVQSKKNIDKADKLFNVLKTKFA